MMDSWLCRAWELVTRPDPAVVAAVIGVLGAIIAGYLGGRIGGRLSVAAALAGADKAHQDNLDRDRRAHEQHLIGFVQAVQAEIEGLQAAFETEIGPAIRALKPGDGLDTVFPVGRDYFFVYPANASLLGHIEDLDLRKSIVKTYIACKAMLDVIHMNNILAEAFERAARNFFIMGGAQAPAAANLDAQVAKKRLVEYGAKIQGTLGTVTAEIDSFYDASNRWLKAHGEKENPQPQHVGSPAISTDKPA